MQPNVLVIVVDALRADRVGALGGRPLTPAVDELAQDAATFTSAYSPANTTDPAVTSIQSGRHPLSHGVVNHGMRVTDREKARVERVPLLPEVLSDAGYRTGTFGQALGRWHRRGFDVYPTVSTHAGLASRGERLKDSVRRTLESVDPRLRDAASAVYQRAAEPLRRQSNQESAQEEESPGDDVVESATSFVTDEEPFFAFVHLMDTHIQYRPDLDRVREYLDRFEYESRRFETATSTQPVPEELLERVRDGDYPEIRSNYFYEDGAPSTAFVDACYDAAVTEADRRIERIVSALRETGRLEDTLVVVLADHGESLTEHGIYYDHHGLYEPSINVPLVLRPPGGSDATVDDLVQTTAVAPTVASYAGADGLDPDDESLRPVVEGEGSVEREFVLAEEAHAQHRRAVRTRDEKLIYLLEGDTVCRYCGVEHAPPEELYDLAADPAERRNRAGERPDDVAALRERAERRAEAYRDRRPGQGDRAVSYDDEDALEERLEALGYR